MDAVPIVEHVEVCADGARIAAAVEESVAFAMARGLSVRVELATAGKGTEAHATIVLPDGKEETRVFSSSTRKCVPISRALGAWVSVRMDEWTERSKVVAAAAPSGAVGPASVAAPDPTPRPEAIGALPISTGLDSAYDVDREGRRVAELEGAELSVVTIVAGNLAPYTLAGGGGAGTFALSDLFVLRATGFALTGATAPDAGKRSLLGVRVDVCRRIPGRYARARSLKLDMCGGAEGGVNEGSEYGAVGPSIMIHGDLAREFSLDLGGGFALPFGGPEREEPGLVVAVRGDLGLTWRLP